MPELDAFYIDLDSYFASAEQQDAPELRGRAVAVVPSREITPNATCIAASYEAKAFGIRTGTKVAEARRLCPDTTFLPARHDRYVELHQRVRSALERVLPVEKTCSIDEFSCVLKGPQRQLGEAIAIARAAKRSIAALAGEALSSSIGLAPNALLAKIAAEMDKPDGLQWILPGEERGKLGELPLLALPGINRRMEARLHAAGVTDIPSLLALEPRHARMIWGGVQGERFLRQLRGEAIPDIPTKRGMIGHSQVLAPQNRTPEAARIVARRLLAKAASRLRRMQFFAARLSLGVKYLGGGRARRETSFAATKDTLVLLAALERLWRQLRHDRPLLNVATTLHGLVPDELYIPDLFEQRPAQGMSSDREALFGLIDTLNQRYGRDTLTYGLPPSQLAPYTGAKIAFNRIPEELEFRE